MLAQHQAAGHPELEAVGVFGSYGRGDAGVGSDLVLLPIWERIRPWDTAAFPLAREVHWLIPPAGADGSASADPVKGGIHR